MFKAYSSKQTLLKDKSHRKCKQILMLFEPIRISLIACDHESNHSGA